MRRPQHWQSSKLKHYGPKTASDPCWTATRLGARREHDRNAGEQTISNSREGCLGALDVLRLGKESEVKLRLGKENEVKLTTYAPNGSTPHLDRPPVFLNRPITGWDDRLKAGEAAKPFSACASLFVSQSRRSSLWTSSRAISNTILLTWRPKMILHWISSTCYQTSGSWHAEYARQELCRNIL
jgi:hypothetical protein